MATQTCRASLSKFRSILAGTIFPGDPETLLFQPMVNPAYRVEVWLDLRIGDEPGRWLKRCEGSEWYCRRVFERMVSANLASPMHTQKTATVVRLVHVESGREVAKANHYEAAS